MQEPIVEKRSNKFRTVRGAISVMCPECGKPTRANMRSGRDVSFCNRCNIWFITTNEVYTERLRNFYQIFPNDEGSHHDD